MEIIVKCIQFRHDREGGFHAESFFYELIGFSFIHWYN